MAISGCTKDPVVPTLTTSPVSNITVSSITSGGLITEDGDAEITARGICYSTSATPVIGGLHTTDDKGTGTFSSTISGLTPNTVYHIRAYATNKVGTAYGEELTASTIPIVLPALSTVTVSAITVNSAVAGGNITSDGNATVTARGVCWSTSANPVITNDKTSDGTGPGAYVSNLTGLLPATSYHIRSYATNSAGTAYGNEITFTTNPVVVPVLTTTAITAITTTSAISGGNITSDGGGSVTARGVCWSTTANPTILNTKTTDATGTGSFTSNLTGLSASITYHVRAYATNSAGTGYGSDITFTANAVLLPTLSTTAVTSITQTTAISGGTITEDGGGSITARGVCWAVTVNPTISGSKTTDGTGTGTFTSSLLSLTPGTTYHIRAYATNAAGTAYGNDILLVTNPVVVPTLSTTGATSITQTSVVSGGNITDNGGGAVTARGVCWSTTANPVLSSSKTIDGSGNGAFTSNVAGLLPGTTYHIRAYATNSAGTAYGNDISINTNPAVVATLSTTAITTITLTTAVSGGTISSDGASAISARGVCWSISSNPTIANSKTSNGTGTGTFTSSLTGLLPGTTYHVRAYATNTAGTAYGNDISFVTTAIVAPTINTYSVSSIGLSSGVSGGNITNDGGGAVTASGICWSTSSNPTIGDSRTTDGTSIGSFTSNITGLTKGTTYYVRAYATNSAGTTYGNQASFNTLIDDIEGNLYKTVTIGSQMWMAENLRATRYNNNTPILNITNDAAWALDSVAETPAYCWYNNDISHKAVDGALYNWYVVLGDNLCPTGWKVPSENDFRTLELYLGIPAGNLPGQVGAYDWRGTDQGAMMKTTSGWDPGFNGTNTSGFTGTPGGYRYGKTGAYYAYGKVTYWWTSTEVGPGENAAWYRRLDGNNDPLDNVTDADNSRVFRSATHKWGAKFIRCIKN
jgi:uncharacterized protein (TIGR02145 family)